MNDWKHDYEQILARGVREDTYSFEAVLLGEIARGNTAVFDAVVAVHSGRIFRLAKRVVKNDDDALDVAQDVYLTMHRKLPEFRGDSEIGSWLHRVTCNAALMHIRKNSRHCGHLTDEALETISNLDRVEENVSNRQVLQQLGKAFRRLSRKHQLVLEMRVGQDLSVGEMAETLGLSVPATKSRIHRARIALLTTAGLA